MRKPKIKLVYRKCPRCGKEVAGINRSITGADEAFKKYAGICGGCLTPKEHKKILIAQGNAIRGK